MDLTSGESALLGFPMSRFHDLPELRDSCDDWTGITSTTQRKKLQNRLNQRAYRRRLKSNRNIATASSDRQPITLAVALNESDRGLSSATEASTETSSSLTMSRSAGLAVPGGLSLLIKQDDVACFRNFVARAYEEYTLNAPRLAGLPLLGRINVLNAFESNAKSLGINANGLCQADLISPFNLHGPCLSTQPQWSSSHCPATLQPTLLQKTLVHHPWIDLLPFTAMRDNMLRLLHLGLLDDDALCFDILEISDCDFTTRPAMMVWGDASDCNSWEVNLAFLRKWGFLIKGCPQVVEATNRWRNIRGEKRIIYEV